MVRDSREAVASSTFFVCVAVGAESINNPRKQRQRIAVARPVYTKETPAGNGAGPAEIVSVFYNPFYRFARKMNDSTVVLIHKYLWAILASKVRRNNGHWGFARSDVVTCLFK